MKRRDFIKTGAVAAGLAGSLKILPSLKAAENDSPKPSTSGTGENRSTDYLRRARSDQFLPKPPVIADARFSPMPLAERVRRKIVPRRGFCSLTPSGGTLLSGNGATMITRHGIAQISAPAGVLAARPKTGAANCDLHLPAGKPVELHLTLNRRVPLDWATLV